jgi:hypothetical protein
MIFIIACENDNINSFDDSEFEISPFQLRDEEMKSLTENENQNQAQTFLQNDDEINNAM